MPIQLHKNGRMVLLHLTNNCKSPILWINQQDFIIDVEVCAMVTGDGGWKARWNADKALSLCLGTILLHRQRMKVPEA